MRRVQPLEIRTSYGWRIGCLAALGLCFVLPFFGSAIYTVAIGEPQRVGVPLLVGTIALVLFSLPIVVLRVSKRDSVRRFDEHGVTCHDGRLHAWSDFQGVREVFMRSSTGPVLNNYDLVFRTGKVPVYFRVAKNEADVLRAVHALSGGVIPWLRPRS